MSTKVVSTGLENLVSQGINFQNTATVSADGGLTVILNCLQAQSGQLTTRTTNTNGILTMSNANHGITANEVIDLYSATGVQMRAATVSNVNGNLVTFTGTAFGSQLPVVNTLVNVGPVKTLTCDVVGANVQSIGFQVPGSSEGMFSLQTSVPAEVLGEDIVSGQDYIWYTGNGVTNPVTGSTIVLVSCSTNNITSNQVVQGSILYN
jgi:hypothetical protein